MLFMFVWHVVVRKFMNRQIRERRMEIMQSTEKEKVALAKERIEMSLGGKQDADGCSVWSFRF